MFKLEEDIKNCKFCITLGFIFWVVEMILYENSYNIICLVAALIIILIMIRVYTYLIKDLKTKEILERKRDDKRCI